MKRRVRFVARGRVQGVGFRYMAQEEASRLGLTGWVRNLPTGEVEGEVEGEAARVDAFCAWCKRGPSGSKVESVAMDEVAVENAAGAFQILR